MEKFYDFNFELPQVVAERVENLGDLQRLLIRIQEGRAKLHNGPITVRNPENVKIVVDLIMEGQTVLVATGDYVVWNQTGETHVVRGIRGEFEASMIPESLRTLIPYKRSNIPAYTLADL